MQTIRKEWGQLTFIDMEECPWHINEWRKQFAKQHLCVCVCDICLSVYPAIYPSFIRLVIVQQDVRGESLQVVGF